MHTNRLAQEKSPYLQQHAHNPVDWYPWGEEAFERAAKEDKPIFLSVGYSTCHWCHVMERESFESDEVAALLNDKFVPVKVDREERPDVDRIYMTFVQATTGGGGWPMSVWLTPELKPFYGGTYFPPDNRYGRPGFKSILEQLANAWSKDRQKIQTSSQDVMRQLSEYASVAGGRTRLDELLFEAGFPVFRRTFDSRHGGFGQAPKFPRPVTLNYLLRYHERTRNQEALDMVLVTLREMARGGMHDQLGGGFHRYSVDERWFVPHFEKMLYDQAQLAVSYLEAFQITGVELYAGIARDIFDYVLRDLAQPEGGFYSAEDADSVLDPAKPEEKGEGAFYVWSESEITEALGQPAAAWFCFQYGVGPGGNVRQDPQDEFTGKNILFEDHTVEEVAAEYHAPVEQVRTTLAASKQKLLGLRARRPRPHLDDKVLTAWNGLMISALAKAAQILDDVRYLAAAQSAASFLEQRMYDASTGLLLRRYRDSDAAIPGFLDDYAFLIQGRLDLYEADFDVRHLDFAEKLAEKERELFEDNENGAFFSTSGSDPRLVLRMKDDYDGAEPSGNAIAILGLLRLARITDRADFRASAERALESFGGRYQSAAATMPQILVALGYFLAPARQIVITDGPGRPALLAAIRKLFLPNSVVLLAAESLAKRLPALAAMHPIGGQAAAYVCENFACQAPVTEVAKLTELLQYSHDTK